MCTDGIGLGGTTVAVVAGFVGVAGFEGVGGDAVFFAEVAEEAGVVEEAGNPPSPPSTSPVLPSFKICREYLAENENKKNWARFVKTIFFLIKFLQSSRAHYRRVQSKNKRVNISSPYFKKHKNTQNNNILDSNILLGQHKFAYCSSLKLPPSSSSFSVGIKY